MSGENRLDLSSCIRIQELFNLWAVLVLANSIRKASFIHFGMQEVLRSLFSGARGS